ncbi:hypothetical protein [[Phormidium] sp. ETS-05]|nr:hypothetical protein [[Phormidium] sp. ETS-05]
MPNRRTTPAPVGAIVSIQLFSHNPSPFVTTWGLDFGRLPTREIA